MSDTRITEPIFDCLHRVARQTRAARRARLWHGFLTVLVSTILVATVASAVFAAAMGQQIGLWSIW